MKKNIKSGIRKYGGTPAVHLELLAAGVGPGDEELVQSFTFCTSSHPITYLGATPVFIDSEADTWNMEPELLEEAIKDRIAKTGKKPKAIVLVALYGMPYKIDRIIKVANKYNTLLSRLQLRALAQSITVRCYPHGRFCNYRLSAK